MFGNLMDKLPAGKLNLKERLDNILVDGQAGGGKVKVVSNANKEIKQVWIDESLLGEGNKEIVEELTMTAVNRALQKAGEISTAEKQSDIKNSTKS